MRNKQILSIFLAILLFVSTCFIGRSFVDVEALYMRDVTAFDLISEIKVGVNIGNSLDSVGSSETSWGNPKITKQLIQTYKELGFDTIRLPVTWRTHIDASGYPEKSWLDRVQEVVDWILDEDLKCILNTHHEQNWLNTSSTGMTMRETKFKNLWTDIATKFRNYDERLMFEAYNEILKKESDWSPADEIDYQNANTLSQAFVDAVRVTGGNNDRRILIINTYGAIREVYGFQLPRDTVPNKLAVQFHSYDPQGFCFAGSQSSWNTQNSGIIDSYCRLFYENYVSKGTPVILGEFGAVNKNNEYDRAQYAKVVAQNCVKYGIKPIWWDDGGDFKLISRQNYSVLFPQIISALIDNSSVGILPSATTYTNSNVVTTYKTFSPTSTTPKVTTTTTAPNIKLDTVKNVNLQVFQNQVLLNWLTVSDADFYRVYKSVNGKEFEVVSEISSNIYSDFAVDNSDVIKYKVTACRNYGYDVFESDFSAVVSNEIVQSDVVTTPTSTLAPSSSVTTMKPDDICLHETVKKNYKKATYFSEGYTGDDVCVKCDGLILKGNVTSKLKLSKPNCTIKKIGKSFRVSYKKTVGATGFQVRYRIKGKWALKTFGAKKNITKIIKNLKKGNYKVQVRSMVVNGKQKAYSSWTKSKNIKIN